MEIIITEVASLTIVQQDPATLRDLLTAGKKVPSEATTLLMQDHAEVKAMYRQHQAESDGGMKSLLAQKICTALSVHAMVEEEVVYPEANRALEDDEMVAEAIDEHGLMKVEIAKIVDGLAAGKSTTRKVKKLMQIVEHHVEEEETEMFPDLRQAGMDLYELGGQVAIRKVEALRELTRQARAAASQA
jgi:hemerythrin-like domain-containing protein